MNEANRKKKKKRDRIILIVTSAVLLLGILAAILVPTVRHNRRLDRAERILLDAGYKVTRTGEGTSFTTGNEKVLGRVEGSGGPKGEFITLIKFRDKETAELYHKAIKGDYTLTLTAVQEGQYVYFGTRLAYEAIK